MTITAEAAAETGLKAGTPVMAGGGDQAAGAVGAGAVRPGVVSLTLGTSGVIFATTDAPLVEPEGRLHAFCHAVPGKWHFMGVTLSAAGSLQWYHDTLTPNESFAEIVAQAERAPAGSDGLLFLPYLSGERTPYPDPLARGSFVGLTVRHTRAHLTRAVLEGVAFSMKDCFGLLQGARPRVREGGPDRRRRRQGRAVAEDRGERPRPADADGQQHGRRGLRRGAPRRHGQGRVADGRGRVRRDDRRHRPRRAGPRVDEGLRGALPALPRSLPGPQADLRPAWEADAGLRASAVAADQSSARIFVTVAQLRVVVASPSTRPTASRQRALEHPRRDTRDRPPGCRGRAPRASRPGAPTAGAGRGPSVRSGRRRAGATGCRPRRPTGSPRRRSRNSAPVSTVTRAGTFSVAAIPSSRRAATLLAASRPASNTTLPLFRSVRAFE